LAPEAGLHPETGPSTTRRYRREFYIMSVAFSLNHATVTTPILYASSVLTQSIGNSSNAVLYGATLLCSLFLANIAYAVCGPKRGLTLAMFCYMIYVGFFALSTSECAKHDAINGKCIEAESLQLPIACIGALIGGMGAGILWTCQGAFYSLVCEEVATAERRPKEDVTAELAGTFGLIFLGFECAVRFFTTILNGKDYADLSNEVTFFIWTGAAFLATASFATFASRLEPSVPVDKAALCTKLLAAVHLWGDPKLWLLQTTNITFGFAAAWLGGWVNSNILSVALKGSSFIGFAGAILSGLAAILAKMLAPIARRIGKGPVLALGSIAFLSLGILSYWGNAVEWGWGVTIFYVLMGIGRAVYESTNKAIIADFFPNEKSPGAFANVFVFGTFASCVAFILGSVENKEAQVAEVHLLLIFAALTLPSFILASVLKTKPRAREVSETSLS